MGIFNAFVTLAPTTKGLKISLDNLGENSQQQSDWSPFKILDIDQMLRGTKSTLLVLNQCLTFILFHELYLLTCQVRLQQNPLICKVLGKCTLAFLVCVTIVLSEYSIVTFAMDDGFVTAILIAITPLTTALVIAATVGDSFLVVRILRALKKNENFRNQFRSQRNGELGILFGLIFCMMSSQIVRLITHLSKVILGAKFFTIFEDVCANHFEVEGILPWEVCSGLVKKYENILLYIRDSLLYASEFAGVCAVMIWKKIHSNQCCKQGRQEGGSP